jgi:hypothetical protein
VAGAFPPQAAASRARPASIPAFRPHRSVAPGRAPSCMAPNPSWEPYWQGGDRTAPRHLGGVRWSFLSSCVFPCNISFGRFWQHRLRRGLCKQGRPSGSLRAAGGRRRAGSRRGPAGLPRGATCKACCASGGPGQRHRPPCRRRSTNARACSTLASRGASAPVARRGPGGRSRGHRPPWRR